MAAHENMKLPEYIGIDEFSELLRMDVEQTRNIVRRNKDVLKPFKLGRHVYLYIENVEVFKNLLEQGKVR